MKKMLFVLAVFLLAVLACPAAADEPLRISPAPAADCTEVLIEPVPHDIVVKWIIFGKYGDDRIGLLSSFVRALKEEPVSFYLYRISYDNRGEGTGTMQDTQMFTASPNPEWTVPGCRFTAPAGQTFSAWDIYGDTVMPGDKIVLTEYETTAFALWKDV